MHDREFKIYNTLSHSKERFQPIHPGEVNIYVCGPTVYDFMHIGNARPLVVFDVLRRLLVDAGYQVRYAMNFTDIDDKIIRRANERGVDFHEVSQRYIDEFIQDREGLNVLAPDFAPQASENIEAMTEMIQQLIGEGYAYIGAEGVYFDVSKDPGYGKLAKLDHEQMQSGRREISYQASDKQHSADFALWKFKREGEPGFPAPFGEGRPGWHIECSAMIHRVFENKVIDIHAGGMDLIFPHHENEIAQSECCHEHELSKYWMHNAYITIVDVFGSENKMSKSLGNFRFVRDLSEHYGYDVLRFFILTAHYRSNLKFYPGALEEAAASLKRIREAEERIRFLKAKLQSGDKSSEAGILSEIAEIESAFYADLYDDLNTAAAIGKIFSLLRLFFRDDSELHLTPRVLEAYQNFLTKSLSILGLDFAVDLALDEDVELLLQRRSEARASKNWQLSDELREQLKQIGYLVKDTPEGQQLSRIEA
ncbi:MAG: cysteine--tRNA ligase [Eubacteriales bacterium]|nr:cysteine--tRNA ligase [Eubacteriales bacterium]